MAIAPMHASPEALRWHALRLSLAWLAHPLSVAAIAVLVINDHPLKSAYRTWWTGKLSDFAGLVFFPALVAVTLAAALPKARYRTLAATSIGASLAGFVWVKATATGAVSASAAWGLVVPGSVVLRDPTDLLALPMLALAWALAARVARDTQNRSTTARRRIQALVVLPFAVIATTATTTYHQYEHVMADIAVVSGELVVVYDDHYASSPGSETDYREYMNSSDGISFTSVEEYERKRLGQVFDARSANESCVPSEPTVCYRPMANAVGVEVSHDGGATWEPEWQVAEMSRLRLCERSSLASANDCPFVTRGVAVWESGEDYQVYAVNYIDDLAVRDAGGTWKRMTMSDGYHPWDSDEVSVITEEGVRDLPPDDPWPSQAPMEALALWSVTGAILTVSGGLWVLGRLREPQPSGTRVAVILGAIGLGLLALAHAIQIVGTVNAPRPSEVAGAAVYLLLTGSVPLLLAAGVTRWAARPVLESVAPSPGTTFTPEPEVRRV